MKQNTLWKTLALCLVCTFLWGAGYPVLKLSYSHWGIAPGDVPAKLLFAGIRFSVAGLILLLAASLRRKAFARPESPKQVVILGLFQTALQYSFTYIGLALTSGSKSSVLNQMSVFLVVLLTPLLLKKERLTQGKLLGCLLGFGGILVMNLEGLSLRLEIGDWFVLGASAFAAAGYLISKAMPKSADALTSTAWQQLTGGVMLLVAGLLTGGKLNSISLPGAGSLLFLILAAAISYSLWFYLLQHNDVGRISVSKFLTPIFGVVFSGLLLGEPVFTPENGIALALVCAGIITVNYTDRVPHRRAGACSRR